MALIRKILGYLILILDRLIPISGKVIRSAQVQAQVDRETQRLALYQFRSCPFCVKVRRKISQLSLKIELKDVLTSQQAHDELMAGGGAYQVPCLRIQDEQGQVRWLYESSDINQWLTDSFVNR
jgi:glutaredoxin